MHALVFSAIISANLNLFVLAPHRVILPGCKLEETQCVLREEKAVPVKATNFVF